MKKRILIALVAITCVFAVFLSGCGKKTETSSKGDESEIETAAIAVATGYALGRYQLASAADVKAKIDIGDIMTIIDTRPESEFKKGHLANAVNVEIPADAEASPEQLTALIAKLPENKESIVIIYDGFTAEGRSAKAAIYVADAGCVNVWRFPGGIAAWKAAKYKLVKK